MQQFEKVSIGGTNKLSDMMNLKPKTTDDIKPTTKRGRGRPKKSNLNKEQIENILGNSQFSTPMMNTAPTATAKTTEKPYTSKENKLNIKEEKMMRVLNYQNSARFGASIKKDLKFNFTRDQLSKKTIEEIDNTLYRIRNYLNNRGMDGIYEQMVRTTAVGYENIVSEFYDIEGFSDMLTQNPAFWDAFERWKIERTLPDIPPSFQLCYIIASTSVLAHMRKRSIQTDEKLKQARPTPAKKPDKETKNTDKSTEIKKPNISVGSKIL